MPRKLKFQHRKKRSRNARLSTKASCSSKDVHESKCDVSSQISSSTHTESPEVGSVSDISSEMSSLTSFEFQVMEPETVFFLLFSSLFSSPFCCFSVLSFQYLLFS